MAEIQSLVGVSGCSTLVVKLGPGIFCGARTERVLLAAPHAAVRLSWLYN